MDFAKYFNAIDAHRQMILDAERHIWKNPEAGYQEWKTHEYLKAKYEALGLNVREFDRIPASVAIQTATDGRDRVFKKIPGFYVDFETGHPGPRLAIFGELDSMIVPSHPECDKATGAVHSCGHNAQCAALLGVAAALAAPGALDGLSGSIRLIAVPAEEFIEMDFRRELRNTGVIHFLGGKQELLYRGLLDDVDLAFMVHTGISKTAAFYSNRGSNGFISAEHIFHGKAAHAGGSPHEGINALYAANLALNAANALRETFRDSEHIRFHPIITEGGAACNSIPDRVVVESGIRASTLQGAIRENSKINRAFAGAAAAMGCGLEIHNINGYAPRNNSREINDVFHQAARLFFEEKNLNFGDGWGTGCSDLGDVSCVMPAAHPYVAGAEGTEHGATYRIADPELACVTSAKVQTAAAVMLLADTAVLARKIVSEYKPLCASVKEYIKLADSVDFDKEVVEYGENDEIKVKLGKKEL